MKKSFITRCSVKDWRLIKAAAAESNMSLNKFVVGSARLLAVLGLQKEQEELVVARLMEKLGPMLDRLGDEVEKRKAS